MTEEEVLIKLEEYKNFIIELQQKNKLLEENNCSLLKENQELKNELEELKKPKPRKKREKKPKQEIEKKWNIEIPTSNGTAVTVTAVPTETIQEEKQTFVSEETNHKMIVKSAEKELQEMIGES